MKKFRIHIEAASFGLHEEVDFEMHDDATEEEVKEEARQVFFDSVNYGIEDLKESEES